jgi:hypothetical protein
MGIVLENVLGQASSSSGPLDRVSEVGSGLGVRVQISVRPATASLQRNGWTAAKWTDSDLSKRRQRRRRRTR